VGIGLGLFWGVHIYECAHIVLSIARIYECSLYHVAFCLPLAFLTLLESWRGWVLRSQVVYMADHDKPCATGRRWHGVGGMAGKGWEMTFGQRGGEVMGLGLGTAFYQPLDKH
jgi:hypothetical protein